MWKALVLRDEPNIIKYSNALGVENWEMFSVLLLMRSYQGANVGLSSRMTREEVEAMIVALTVEIKRLSEVMKNMPREILLVLRNCNLVRSINRDLGTPCNRFSIMARLSAFGLHTKENFSDLWWPNRFLRKFKRWRETLGFDVHLNFYIFIYWLSDVTLAFLQWTGQIPAIDIEAVTREFEKAS